MNVLDRCLFSLALLLTIVGSIALYAQGQVAERQSKMQLQQAAVQERP